MTVTSKFGGISTSTGGSDHLAARSPSKENKGLRWESDHFGNTPSLSCGKLLVAHVRHETSRTHLDEIERGEGEGSVVVSGTGRV